MPWCPPPCCGTLSLASRQPWEFGASLGSCYSGEGYCSGEHCATRSHAHTRAVTRARTHARAHSLKHTPGPCRNGWSATSARHHYLCAPPRARTGLFFCCHPNYDFLFYEAITVIFCMGHALTWHCRRAPHAVGRRRAARQA